MGQVGWIKVKTDIFSNRKIKILLKEREGDTYFRLWIQILTIAGECTEMVGYILVIMYHLKLKILRTLSENLPKLLRKFSENLSI